MIACVRLPHFGPGLEQQDRPALAGRPLVLVDETDRITDCSAEAALSGVRVGMSAAQAQTLCDGLSLLPASPARYRRVFFDLLAALTRFTDLVEPETGLELRADARQRRQVPFVLPVQVDELPAATCYLDLGRLSVDEAHTLAGQLYRFVQDQVGLRPAIGLADGKFPARVAALLAEPDRPTVISPEQTAFYLAPFTVILLPVDGETIRQLHLLGLYTLGDVASQPVTALVDRFGRQGRVLHRLANGRDTSPVARYEPPVRVCATHHFDAAVADWAVVQAVLGRQMGDISARLQKVGQAARRVGVALQLDDGTHLARDTVLRQPTAHQPHLLETAVGLAESLPVSAGVTEIEVVVDDLGPPVARQLSLFDREPVSATQLKEVLAGLVKRYGEDCFYWAQVMDSEARLPERRVRVQRVGEK
jgi:DNA polymerase-4